MYKKAINTIVITYLYDSHYKMSAIFEVFNFNFKSFLDYYLKKTKAVPHNEP
jgi:hypothetical protein